VNSGWGPTLKNNNLSFISENGHGDGNETKKVRRKSSDKRRKSENRLKSSENGSRLSDMTGQIESSKNSSVHSAIKTHQIQASIISGNSDQITGSKTDGSEKNSSILSEEGITPVNDHKNDNDMNFEEFMSSVQDLSILSGPVNANSTEIQQVPNNGLAGNSATFNSSIVSSSSSGLKRQPGNSDLLDASNNSSMSSGMRRQFGTSALTSDLSQNLSINSAPSPLPHAPTGFERGNSFSRKNKPTLTAAPTVPPKSSYQRSPGGYSNHPHEQLNTPPPPSRKPSHSRQVSNSSQNSTPYNNRSRSNTNENSNVNNNFGESITLSPDMKFRRISASAPQYSGPQPKSRMDVPPEYEAHLIQKKMNQATISRNGHMPTNFVTQNPYNQNHAYNQQQQYNSYTPSNNSTPMSLPRNSQYNSPYLQSSNSHSTPQSSRQMKNVSYTGPGI
jgi:hypothetical protein